MDARRTLHGGQAAGGPLGKAPACATDRIRKKTRAATTEEEIRRLQRYIQYFQNGTIKQKEHEIPQEFIDTDDEHDEDESMPELK